VVRECSFIDEDGQGRTDIELHDADGRVIVVIEAKIQADEGLGQRQRYSKQHPGAEGIVQPGTWVTPQAELMGN
jgi:D-Tyr-tRNAtyr deacylase